jgi:hypothetical protein
MPEILSRKALWLRTQAQAQLFPEINACPPARFMRRHLCGRLIACHQEAMPAMSSCPNRPIASQRAVMVPLEKRF